MTHVIRPAQDEDGTALVTLIGGCWKEYPGCDVPVEAEIPDIHELATSYAGKGGALWVAENGNGVTGMIGVRPHGDGWEISKMYVAAGARGSGVAQDLLGLAEDFARRHPAPKAILWSDTRFLRAHRFYEKQGYVRTGAIRTLHDLAQSLEFHFEKPLGESTMLLNAAAAASAAKALAGVMVECVADGASLGFRAPLATDKAITLFESLGREVAEGRTRLIAGWIDGRLAGCAALRWDGRETEPHVAELARLIVASWARRRGLARRLISRLEETARQDGRRVIYLLVADDGAGPGLYHRLGYRQSGCIPQGGGLPDGTTVDALIFSKLLIWQE